MAEIEKKVTSNADAAWVAEQLVLIERLRELPGWGDRRHGLTMTGPNGQTVEVKEHDGALTVKVKSVLKK